jgi:uncharacterized protein (TIGR03083 family)
VTEQMDKGKLLEEIQNEYANFSALLASLSDEQMTTKGVNGEWSVKDNLAHLTAWQRYLLDVVQRVREGATEPHPWVNMTEDEENEQIYQEHKDLPLAEVLAQFHSSYQQVLDTVRTMSDEEIELPLPSKRPVWQLIAGNTYEHYQEHGKIIQDWLAHSQSV